ncbi:hypothetical protein COLO4_26583 [Corchorus olitorius]|uniref:Uncharacterized protein n=1 Tax=Corchorus olitorius TaxID=93759 RepID=A0A1R3HWE8_9ROSI|nr:hypothetical protein COLO4_26583 [Corchorus olitorius]
MLEKTQDNEWLNEDTILNLMKFISAGNSLADCEGVWMPSNAAVLEKSLIWSDQDRGVYLGL